MNPPLSDLLEIAKSAAFAAGQILREGAGLRQVNFQDAHDVKLQADVDSERLIRQRLESAAPGIPIIGEEEGGDASLTTQDRLYWVVDPLDGTANYQRGIPLCAVSIGLMRGLEPVLGVIYDFNHDDCYAALADGPLTLNHRVHQPVWAETADLAVVCTGFPIGCRPGDAGYRRFFEMSGKFTKIRMLGSAAMGMALVARGECDVYFEDGIRLWDIAAGLSLVAAAGGHYRIFEASQRDKPFAHEAWVAGRAEWLPKP